MEAWTNIVNMALLGSEKRGGASGAVEALTGVVPDASLAPERALMRDITLLSVYRRGGPEPLMEHTPQEFAPPETRPYAGPGAEAVLAEIIAAGNDGLLKLWLERAVAAEVLIPLQHLDLVLDAAQKRYRVHSLLREAAGGRGRWLAAFNPQWSFMGDAPAGDDWEHGSSVERAAFLQKLRHENPAKARELLESVWATEPADQRERLLGALETGLSPDDGPFIEQATGDKSKRVAAQANDLLTAIPGSSVVRAFEAWLRIAVQRKSSFEAHAAHDQDVIRITEPGADKLLESLIGKAPAGTGAEIYRLQRISEMTPPQFWESHLDATPGTIIDMLFAGKGDVYPEALASAAARFQDARWAAILAERATGFYPVLLPLLDPAVQSEYLVKHAAAHPAAVLDFYRESSQEWLPGIAGTLLQHAASEPDRFGKAFLKAEAAQIPLSALNDLDSITPSLQPGAASYLRNYAIQTWPATRMQLRDALEMKARILNAFT